MVFELESGLVLNSIFLTLTSLRPSELSMVERKMDEVSVICQAKAIPFQKCVVPSGDDLIRALVEIEAAARNGLKTLICLDMHRSAVEGVDRGDERDGALGNGRQFAASDQSGDRQQFAGRGARLLWLLCDQRIDSCRSCAVLHADCADQDHLRAWGEAR